MIPYAFFLRKSGVKSFLANSYLQEMSQSAEKLREVYAFIFMIDYHCLEVVLFWPYAAPSQKTVNQLLVF
jgi:hypothetical protein